MFTSILRLAVTPLVVLLLAPFALAEDDAATKELKKFEGRWRLLSLETEGETHNIEDENVVTIKGDRITTKDDQVFSLKVDGAVEPKVIDLTHQTGDQKGKVLEGIYKFKDDELTVCIFGGGDGAKKRPIEFSAKQGSGCLIVVLKKLP